MAEYVCCRSAMQTTTVVYVDNYWPGFLELGSKHGSDISLQQIIQRIPDTIRPEKIHQKLWLQFCKWTWVYYCKSVIATISKCQTKNPWSQTYRLFAEFAMMKVDGRDRQRSTAHAAMHGWMTIVKQRNLCIPYKLLNNWLILIGKFTVRIVYQFWEMN